MHEVFEKIITNLEAEVFKSRGNLIHTYAFEKAIEIVKQEAEEYGECFEDCRECEAYDKEKHYCPRFCYVLKEAVKEIEEYNGWILCSERMPKEPEEGLTNLDECDEYIVMIENADIPTALNYAGNGEWYRDGVFYDVIAWKPLPEPYQPRTCADKECTAAEGCAGYEEPEWKNHLMNRFMNGE